MRTHLMPLTHPFSSPVISVGLVSITEVDALLLGVVRLPPRGREARPPSGGRLSTGLRSETLCGAHRVRSHVAAAHHHYLAACVYGRVVFFVIGLREGLARVRNSLAE